jgi:malonate-semialdehyde dehydrogenase (acetylating)/methylmalonate-semialdehyde dehydrogenase
LQGKEGFDFFTQNKVSTIRVVTPAAQLAADAVAEKPAEIPAGKGGVRSCIAS